MQACAEAWPGGDVLWDWRSLEAFGDQPLDDLAETYDVLVIDHPFCGQAAAAGLLLPLGGLIGADALNRIITGAVGPSGPAYCHRGELWALPTDAACQVSAVHAGLLAAPPPSTWDEVLVLAHERPGTVALALAPAHALASFLTLCSNLGDRSPATDWLAPRDTGLEALGLLDELFRLGPPEALDWEPPDVLERLATGDLVYVPLVFSYLTYAAQCRFVDIPGVHGAVLGGAGLAVSALSTKPIEAAAFAAWVAEPSVQLDVVAPAGGQPASRMAWLDPTLDVTTHCFYSGTLRTIEAAWVRPRERWWPAFQLQAGGLVAGALRERTDPKRTLTQLESLYASCRRETT